MLVYSENCSSSKSHTILMMSTNPFSSLHTVQYHTTNWLYIGQSILIDCGFPYHLNSSGITPPIMSLGKRALSR